MKAVSQFKFDPTLYWSDNPMQALRFAAATLASPTWNANSDMIVAWERNETDDCWVTNLNFNELLLVLMKKGSIRLNLITKSQDCVRAWCDIFTEKCYHKHLAEVKNSAEKLCKQISARCGKATITNLSGQTFST
jgi:hypothetical protein